jgi:hypothetical protein
MLLQKTDIATAVTHAQCSVAAACGSGTPGVCKDPSLPLCGAQRGTVGRL